MNRTAVDTGIVSGLCCVQYSFWQLSETRRDGDAGGDWILTEEEEGGGGAEVQTECRFELLGSMCV